MNNKKRKKGRLGVISGSLIMFYLVITVSSGFSLQKKDEIGQGVFDDLRVQGASVPTSG